MWHQNSNLHRNFVVKCLADSYYFANAGRKFVLEGLVTPKCKVFRFYRAHTSVLCFWVLPLPLTYRTTHGVHTSIERATSHHALKRPSIICIPYVAGGGWELYTQGVISKRIRSDRTREGHVMTISYHTLPYHTIPYLTIPYHTLPYLTIPSHTVLVVFQRLDVDQAR